MECAQGEPDLFVCMSCLEEVFQAQVPVNGCPGCGAISTFEAFSIDAIREWGTESLIAKAARFVSGTGQTDSPSQHSIS